MTSSKQMEQLKAYLCSNDLMLGDDCDPKELSVLIQAVLHEGHNPFNIIYHTLLPEYAKYYEYKRDDIAHHDFYRLLVQFFISCVINTYRVENPKPVPQVKNEVTIAFINSESFDINRALLKFALENEGIEAHDLGDLLTPRDILEMYKMTPTRFLLLSLDKTRDLDLLIELIAQLHKNYLNPPMLLVGGPLISAVFAYKANADMYYEHPQHAAMLLTDFFKVKEVGCIDNTLNN
jgi:methanogenic corrinoid protein MtbC1